jgi:hypothetical protein
MLNDLQSKKAGSPDECFEAVDLRAARERCLDTRDVATQVRERA